MKKRKRGSEKTDRTAARAENRGLSRRWRYALAVAGALLVALEVYRPALRGPFVFDDQYLPFTAPEFADKPLPGWFIGVRPLLILSFWLNFRLSALEPFSYHLFNVVFHFLTSVAVFLVVRRLLSWAGLEGAGRELLSLFAAGIFLLHPVQTESVSYVASRSETLSVMFFYAAFALFLYRRSKAISWLEAFGVLLLFGAAVSTKEHAAVLPALLLLTDYFWDPGFSLEGIRRNWRLYLPLLAAGLLAVRLIWNVLRSSDSAGFALKELGWHQYFFTQCRAIWVYIRLFFLPYGQRIDYDMPISRTIWEHGAIFGLAGLLALVIAAFHYRRRYPLACYGFLTFLLLLAPTSSVVPIADPIAERRFYLPMAGLLLAISELLRRWKASRRALAGTLATLLVIAGWLSYQRNQVWGSSVALWEDAVAKSPGKARAHFQLAFAYYEQGRCELALRHYQTVAQLSKPDYRLLVDWGLAYDCLGKWPEAVERLRQAAALQGTAHVYSLIGYVYAKHGKRAESLEALERAAKLDPGYDMTYLYRGGVYAAGGDFQAAAEEYRHALRLNPRNETAREALAGVEGRLRKLR